MVGYKTLIDPQLFFSEQMDHLDNVESKYQNFQRLLGRHRHTLNEHPFFGILDNDLETLIWSGGGQDLAPLLGLENTQQNPVTSLSGLFNRLGIEDAVRREIQEEMAMLTDGAAMSFINRLSAKDGYTFSIVFKHRGNERHGTIQFTLTDMSFFIETERAVRSMASKILERMGQPSESGRSDLERLHRIQTFAGKLLLLTNDKEIEIQASTLVAKVETLAVRTIEILRGFEEEEPEVAEISAPANMLQDLSIALPCHTRSFGDWSALLKRAKNIANADDSLSAHEAHHLFFADSFIRHALPVMIYTDPAGKIYVLNGEKCGKVYNDVDLLVRDLGVEEDSRRSASDFFSARPSRSVTLSINNKNAEVRGRGTPGDGWQVMILPAMTDSIDVRGLFHAFKNLLLNLQVLYVVKTRKDVEEIGAALIDTLGSINERIENLRYLAKHGTATIRRSVETVEMWVKVASRATGGQQGSIKVTGIEKTGHLAFKVPPGEMEDTLSEIVRNAFTNGARNLSIGLSTDERRLMIAITDDGDGISEQKLRQIRDVIETRRYDPTLTTRSDGSGHGILGAAKVLSHFMGGHLEIGPSPLGQGTQVRLSMRLPN